MGESPESGGQRPKRWWGGGPERSALRIVSVYAVVAAAWIFGSDTLARALTVDPNLLTLVGIAKGVFFVLVTSALLFFQIRMDFARLQESGERLRESAERFRRVIDVSPVPMAVNDADGNITLLNAAFIDLLGYTREDIPTLERWWPTAYPDPDYRRRIVDAWNSEMERTRKTGDAFTPLKARIRCRDGSERTMLLSTALLGPGSSEQVVVLYDITAREAAEEAVLRSNERLALVLKSVIALIGKVIEARDPYTQGHEEGVARISRLIAEEMGLSADATNGIEVAALVHDVGKLGVPTEILTKPGELADVERQIIRDHSQLGHDILKDIDFGWPVADIVLQHHERMDGSGYPHELHGEDILMAARVLMAADVIEAMGAHRPYRPALGLDAAMAEITAHPEKFDAMVVAAAVRLYDEGRIKV